MKQLLINAYHTLFNIKRSFHYYPFIYLDDKRQYTNEITNLIQWLPNFNVEATTQKLALSIALKSIREKFPQYKSIYFY